jgi:hypothetical protein
MGLFCYNKNYFISSKIMTNPITYTELSSLMRRGKDISSLLHGNCKKNYYGKILEEAVKEYDNELIEALAANLPLDAWFDKDEVLKSFQDLLGGKIYDAKKYDWCMIIPQVRKCFSPEEKGHFVHVGFVVNSHEMSYHATLDHDWQRNLPDHIIDQALRYVKSFSVRSLNTHHPKVDYFKWFSNEILPKFSEKNQHLYLLSSFCITIGQLREISEQSILSDIDLLKTDDKKEALKKMLQDLKDSIDYFKKELNFDDWTNDFKNDFIRLSTEPIASTVSKMTELDELEPFAEKLATIVRYNQLDKQIEQKEDATNKRKSKI